MNQKIFIVKSLLNNLGLFYMFVLNVLAFSYYIWLVLVITMLGIVVYNVEKNDEIWLAKNDGFWLANEYGDLNIAIVTIIIRNLYIVLENFRAKRSILSWPMPIIPMLSIILMWLKFFILLSTLVKKMTNFGWPMNGDLNTVTVDIIIRNVYFAGENVRVERTVIGWRIWIKIWGRNLWRSS